VEKTISRGFYIGVYEVTQEEYEKIMGVNPSVFCPQAVDQPEKRKKVEGMDTRSFPVENVALDEAKAFCAKLSALKKEKGDNRVYRLPTSAEWEYACRGGASAEAHDPFHFGKALSSREANFNGDYPYGGAKPGDYLGRTCQVGSYKPNRLGLFDMHGNVCEWCADGVGKGGGYFSHSKECRSAFRHRPNPKGHVSFMGFRVIFEQAD
jgi:formylglycine-generating enzyme required for sulfatase activity